MKLTGIVCIGLLAATCAADAQRGKRQQEDSGAVNRACRVDDCFNEGEIRDFEVIDRTHVVVFVGPQRCAFHVELRGAFCDLTYAPELQFRADNEVPMIHSGRMQRSEFEEPSGIVPRSSGRSVDAFDQSQRERRDARICDNDLTMQVHGGAFTESAAIDQPTDRFGNQRTDCRVSGVMAITDDQLVELYVGHKVVPPLPPMGGGEIEVGEQEEGAAPPSPRSADEQN